MMASRLLPVRFTLRTTKFARRGRVVTTRLTVSASAYGPGAEDNDSDASCDRIRKQITETYKNGPGLIIDGGLGGKSLEDFAKDPILGSYATDTAITAPRDRITVMVVGKSSFINWYIGEAIQSTGVAITTSGFTIITSGKCRETLTGDTTLKFFPQLSDLGKIQGLKANLVTEVVPSTERSFPAINFVDTPGLVPVGGNQYPFNVEDCILAFAKHCDLICVFFDPQGQAMCSLTMSVVDKLNKDDVLKSRCLYYLTKADTVESEVDRIKLSGQIATSLNPQVPNALVSKLCEKFDLAIKQMVQSNLHQLDVECKRIAAAVSQAVIGQRTAMAFNAKADITAAYFLLGSVVVLCAALFMLTIELAATYPGVASLLVGSGLLPLSILPRAVPWATYQFLGLLGGLYASWLLVALRQKPAAVLSSFDRTRLDSFEQCAKKLESKSQDLFNMYTSTFSS